MTIGGPLRFIKTKMDGKILNKLRIKSVPLQFLFLNIVHTQACSQSSGMTKMLRLTESLCFNTCYCLHCKHIS